MDSCFGFEDWVFSADSFLGGCRCACRDVSTRVRATGSGVSFNFGRVIVALLMIVTSLALKSYFEGSYDQVGLVCGYVYLLGVVTVFLLPATTKNGQLGEKLNVGVD